jgi:hypothetical protein
MINRARAEALFRDWMALIIFLALFPAMYAVENTGTPGDLIGLGFLAGRSTVTVEWVSPDGKEAVFSSLDGDRKLIELDEYQLKFTEGGLVVGQKYKVASEPHTRWNSGAPYLQKM